MNRRRWFASVLLVLTALGAGGGLAAWKIDAQQEAAAAAANQPEYMEAIETALAERRDHQSAVTAIGTVLALRSVTLRNELPGTVDRVALRPGAIVEAGMVLVTQDVSVEEAELRAQEAQAALAQAVLERHQRANVNRAVSDVEVERVRAERDVAQAQIARTRAVIARKTLRAPFRARVGLADVHPGQYLDAGSVLTTLQSVDGAAHVDFSVAQHVAAGLRRGGTVEVLDGADATPSQGTIVAIDARVDATTRNALVRARVAGAAGDLVPGAAVRVRIPVGTAESAVAVPVSALRRGPAGDHVFVIAADDQGHPRAQTRPVQAGAMSGDEILIRSGLAAGERVATSGSFKLQEAMLVAVAGGGSDPSAIAASQK